MNKNIIKILWAGIFSSAILLAGENMPSQNLDTIFYTLQVMYPPLQLALTVRQDLKEEQRTLEGLSQQGSEPSSIVDQEQKVLKLLHNLDEHTQTLTLEIAKINELLEQEEARDALKTEANRGLLLYLYKTVSDMRKVSGGDPVHNLSNDVYRICGEIGLLYCPNEEHVTGSTVSKSPTSNSKVTPSENRATNSVIIDIYPTPSQPPCEIGCVIA